MLCNLGVYLTLYMNLIGYFTMLCNLEGISPCYATFMLFYHTLEVNWVFHHTLQSQLHFTILCNFNCYFTILCISIAISPYFDTFPCILPYIEVNWVFQHTLQSKLPYPDLHIKPM